MEELFVLSPEQRVAIEALIHEGTTLSHRPVTQFDPELHAGQEELFVEKDGKHTSNIAEHEQLCSDIMAWSKKTRKLLNSVEKELVIMFDVTTGNFGAKFSTDDNKGNLFLGITFLESLIDEE